MEGLQCVQMWLRLVGPASCSGLVGIFVDGGCPANALRAAISRGLIGGHATSEQPLEPVDAQERRFFCQLTERLND